MTSYPQLIRNSKLATYLPAVEQVYSSYGGHLARGAFGLKHKLPSKKAIKAAPFIRITDMDMNELGLKLKVTRFRKANREASFVKRWTEAGLPIRAADGSRPVVRSRFAAATLDAPAPAPRPSPVALSDAEFEALLARLDSDGVRARFLEYLVNARRIPEATTAHLHEHAQRNAADLIRAAEFFLRGLGSDSRDLPALPHATLGLQYAPVLPIEARFARPIPARILGPSAEARDNRASGASSLFASVLGKVESLSAEKVAAAGAAPTTTMFFPDAEGRRSNAPGRVLLRAEPAMNIKDYLNRDAAGGFAEGLAGGAASKEPTALSLVQFDYSNTTAVTAPPPVPGSQQYCDADKTVAPPRHRNDYQVQSRGANLFSRKKPRRSTLAADVKLQQQKNNGQSSILINILKDIKGDN